MPVGLDGAQVEIAKHQFVSRVLDHGLDAFSEFGKNKTDIIRDEIYGVDVDETRRKCDEKYVEYCEERFRKTIVFSSVVIVVYFVVCETGSFEATKPL